MVLNVGKKDRTIRITVGIILLAVGFFVMKAPVWKIIFDAVGLIFLLTGYFRVCPGYIPLGINTNKEATGK